MTPTCFIEADETGEARALEAVVDQANGLDREDTVVLLPCNWRWLREPSLSRLADRIRACRHPVALIMQADEDPLKRRYVPEGLRQLCRSCPRLLLWRTDLAAFDAMAHGASGAAVGASAVLRFGAAPRPDSGGGSRKTTYALHGWTKDNSWSSSNVSITLADRDRLTPGKVRYDSASDNGDESAITVSTAEFKTRACQNM